ncbi:MAG: hypothetical protein Q9188_005287 [Gyalolechia gomerana]
MSEHGSPQEVHGQQTHTPETVAAIRQEFLRQDADITQKSFRRWYHGGYLRTPDGKALPRAARSQFEQLLETKTPALIGRYELRHDVARVIQIWQTIPLIEDSIEWKQAKLRLLANMMCSGVYQWRGNVEHVKELPFSPAEYAAACCWVFKKTDGTIKMHEPIRQVWLYKDLDWCPITKSLTTVVGIPRAYSAPDLADDPAQPLNPDSHRISESTMFEVITGTYQPSGVRQGSSNQHQANLAFILNDHDEIRPRSRQSTLSVAEIEEGLAEGNISLWNIPLYTGEDLNVTSGQYPGEAPTKLASSDSGGCIQLATGDNVVPAHRRYFNAGSTQENAIDLDAESEANTEMNDIENGYSSSDGSMGEEDKENQPSST